MYQIDAYCSDTIWYTLFKIHDCCQPLRLGQNLRYHPHHQICTLHTPHSGTDSTGTRMQMTNHLTTLATVTAIKMESKWLPINYEWSSQTDHGLFHAIKGKMTFLYKISWSYIHVKYWSYMDNRIWTQLIKCTVSPHWRRQASLKLRKIIGNDLMHAAPSLFKERYKLFMYRILLWRYAWRLLWFNSLHYSQVVHKFVWHLNCFIWRPKVTREFAILPMSSVIRNDVSWSKLNIPKFTGKNIQCILLELFCIWFHFHWGLFLKVSRQKSALFLVMPSHQTS